MATSFKLKSGNASAFKNLGSSPAKQVEGNFNMTGSKASTTPGFNTTNKGKFKAFKDAANKIKTVSSKTNVGNKVVNALKNTPKQYIKPAKEILKTTNRNMISAGKQVAKKGGKKILSKVASRSIPVVGEALMLYDLGKGIVKNIKEGKTKLPEAKATAFSGGKTWTEAKEAPMTTSKSNKGFNFNKGKKNNG